MTEACAVLDIDGVLADTRHRLHFLDRRPKDWDGFFAAATADPVLDVGVSFAHTASATHQIVYLTGRPVRLRQPTAAWLERNGLPNGQLVMRRDGDRRPAVAFKMNELRRLARQLRIEVIVDDDPAVIAAARAAGFTVRLADWMSADEQAQLTFE